MTATPSKRPPPAGHVYIDVLVRTTTRDRMRRLAKQQQCTQGELLDLVFRRERAAKAT